MLMFQASFLPKTTKKGEKILYEMEGDNFNLVQWIKRQRRKFYKKVKKGVYKI